VNILIVFIYRYFYNKSYLSFLRVELRSYLPSYCDAVKDAMIYITTVSYIKQFGAISLFSLWNRNKQDSISIFY
jgi:hypothetical protein